MDNNFEIVNKLTSSSRNKNYIFYETIYLYTNLVLSSNSATLIVSSKEINTANTNKVLEKKYNSIYINDKRLESDINYIVTECFLRNLRIKIVFNEIE
jgi:hypothetical protein|nr:MAG TPA: hypothetical protein [Crassvirales sp.]